MGTGVNLYDLAARIGDPTEALEAMRDQALLDIALGFVTGTDPEGHLWPDVAESTRLRKTSPYILVESQRLSGSIVGVVEGDSVIIGPDDSVEYHKIQFFGGLSGRLYSSYIPPRPYVGATPETLAVAGHFLLEHWQGGLQP